MKYRFLTEHIDPPLPYAVDHVADLMQVHGLMRNSRYRNDYADDWTPDMNRDCQGKVSAGALELIARGYPVSCLRGYKGWAAIKHRHEFEAHAILVVAIDHSDAPLLWVADNCQASIRPLGWMLDQKLYRDMKPAMRVEVEA